MAWRLGRREVRPLGGPGQVAGRPTRPTTPSCCCGPTRRTGRSAARSTSWRSATRPGRRPTSSSTTGRTNHQLHGEKVIDATQWHNWAVEWTPDEDHRLRRRRRVVLDHPGRRAAARAHAPDPAARLVPGSGGGAVQQSEMQVDWVRYYPVDGSGSATAITTGDTNTATTTPSPAPPRPPSPRRARRPAPRPPRRRLRLIATPAGNGQGPRRYRRGPCPSARASVVGRADVVLEQQAADADQHDDEEIATAQKYMNASESAVSATAPARMIGQ